MSDDFLKRISTEIGKDFNKGINIPNSHKVQFVNPAIEHLERINQLNKEVASQISLKQEKEERYKQAVLKTLQSIEQNTGDITQLVLLVQENNDKQKEILEVISAIMEISSSRTIEEVDNKYRAVMDKANQLNEDVETATKLIGYAKIVWIASKEMIKKKLGIE